MIWDKRGITLNLTQKDAESKLLYPDLSYKIRGACFELRKELGWGHKEVIYQRGLHEKFKAFKLDIDKEKKIPILVEGKKVGIYIPDFVIGDKVMIEVKAKDFIIKPDLLQFWQYLRCTSYKLGFLINFGDKQGVKIIRRVYDTARNNFSA